MAEMPDKSQLSPTSLTLEMAAKLLSALGKKRLNMEAIQKDVDAGAPLNSDGTLNLVSYAAWLVKKEAGHAD